MSSESKGRSIEVVIETDAAPEKVWAALTEARHLASWFPLKASNKGEGVGAKVGLSWGEGAAWETTVTAWEPGRHVQWTDEPMGDPPAVLVVDFHIEQARGKTIVRLVHSGFGAGASWDDMYEGTKGGWSYFMKNLAHYMDHHYGTARTMVSDRRPAGMSYEETWMQLLGPKGLAIEPPVDQLSEGDAFRARLGDQSLEGSGIMSERPYRFAATLPSLNDALLFVQMEVGGESWKCGVWLSAYGLEPARTESLQAALTKRADAVFPAAS